MFEGFTETDVETTGAVIRLVHAGSGPPLLLLHGYPQTRAMWHKVAPRLAERFTVVVPDLRGYGDSSKPPTDSSHFPYSKRAMATDQVEVMTALGFEEFFVAAHDRGGRVGHRMALDHPARVKRLALLDIIPTRTLYATIDQKVATGYFHWFFLIQPFDFPETLIGADPEYYMRRKTGQWAAAGEGITEEAMNEYLRCFTPETIHASCEDYRAAATIDLEHDEADIEAKIACSLLVLWGAKGLMGRAHDVLATWRDKAVEVSGRALPCGHYLPEEAPEETLDELLRFFA
jgi:haloacetate dehalogenase